MKISYVHLYSSYFSNSLATEISNRLQIIFPLIKIDLKSSIDYFSKNMIADDNGEKLLPQFLKDSFQHFDFEKISSIVDTTGIIIDGFTFKEFIPTLLIKMRFILSIYILSLKIN